MPQRARAAVAAARAPADAAQPYVLGHRPWPDLGLMVLPPLWVVPLVFLLATLSSDRQVNDTVFALGAIGHQLPGMVRAYGDRALFRRYRARFLLAPLVLALLCWNAAVRDLHAIVAIAFAWGVWHALAQSYGFARIYGARAGVTDRASALADKATLVVWFIAVLAWSPFRLAFFLDLAALCGLPLPPAAAIRALQLTLALLAGLVTCAWIAVTLQAARAGRGPGGLRVLTLVTSIGFWCFANLRVQHVLLAAPLFELLHDAQYLTIVWVFNRRRANAGDGGLARPLRALFRPTPLSIATYVGVVLGYGALLWSGASASASAATTVFAATSQLLHFYFDGFIWKVREPATAALAGIAADGRSTGPRVARPVLRHALVWVLVGVPYLALWASETRAALPEADRIAAVASLVPTSTIHRYSAAELQWRHGDRAAAVEGFRAVLAIDGTMTPVRRNLVLSLGQLGDEAAGNGAGAELARTADELRALRPLLDDELRGYVDERLRDWLARGP